MKRPTDLYPSLLDYYPFGMPMPSCGYGTGYRFGFNGKEQDNEVEGKGGILNYGSRIYDPRLGRWFSIDQLYKKYAYESNYTFGANSPIITVDEGGKKKTLYITLIDKSGKTTEFKLVNEKDVRFHPIDNGDQGVTFFADVNQDITVDLRKPAGNQVTVGKENFSSSKQSWFSSDNHDLEGSPNTQKGGFHLVNGKGGVDPESDKSESNAEIIDIEALDAVDAVLGFELGGKLDLKEALGGAEALNTVKNLKNSVDDLKAEQAANRANNGNNAVEQQNGNSSNDQGNTTQPTYRCTNNCGFEGNKAQSDSIQKADPNQHNIEKKPE